ncbi:MAG TPA: SLBB domain-containing protein [Gemmatimonadaceae bacterium]|nr:SLBB domain-containing protein [Gemmatimonadaceae bacterium]
MAAAIGLLALGATGAAAQQGGEVAEPVPASRQALEARAAAAEKAAVSGPADQRDAKRQEAAAIRERLRVGDFRVGDRIAISVIGGEKAIQDTAVVRAGRVLQLPDLPNIPLQGVLHSEIEPYLTAQLGRYIRQPTVTAVPLIRLGVLGQVKSPGFYSVPADILVSDAIMVAGGPTGNADVDKSTITRGTEEVWSTTALRKAIVSGMTLDQLDLRAGDELTVGQQTHHNLLEILRAAGIVVGLGLSIYAISRR